MSTSFRSLACILCLLTVAKAIQADDSKIGSPAPQWSGLAGVDGRVHSLDELDEAKVVVVAFTCNSCPYATAYEDRLVEFANEYAPKGVALVAINVSNEEDDNMAAMTKRANIKGYSFPYLSDPSQKTGKAYGAKVTPHLFVLDENRKIAYVGAFDNAKNEAKVTKQYLRDAVDALLAGKTPEVSQTRAAGCSIRYEDD